MTNVAKGERGWVWKDLAIALLCFALVIGFLFRDSFDSAKVLFSNDAPLGLISSQAGMDASTYDGIVTGYWHDLNWIGMEMPSVLPGLSWGMFQLFGTPVNNAKFHVPLSLLYLGFCAWFLFRTLGFSQAVCILGGLAAALNMNPFSHATWGLPSRALTWGSALLAIAALYSGSRGRPIIKAILAGMCVGLGIVEGFDVGALYSLYIAAFGIFITVTHAREPAPKPKLFAIGAIRVAVVAVSSAIFAAHALSVLVSTQIEGIEGLKQDAEARDKRWDQATGWSLPKAETFRVMIPGLFGYRMDTPEGGYYWGSVGFPAFAPRHSGAGEYAGILVVLGAAWGVANAFRKKGNLYTDGERKVVIFWSVAALISILFAWGRWAPFYKLIYGLPFFSTIRNPIKFMHFFHLSLLILFGYGMQLLIRNYAAVAKEKAGGFKERFQAWWGAAAPFERKVVMALSLGLIVSFVGFLIYTSSRPQLEKHLVTAGFPEPYNKEVAAFSQGEVGKYLVFYIASLGAILLCVSGSLMARTAAIVFGVILVIDLGRANLPWIKYVDYKAKYVRHGIIDLLAKEPYERRVTAKLNPFSGQYFANDQISGVFNEWLPTLFQKSNIQSLDIIQFPRIPELDAAYRDAFLPTNQAIISRAVRFWELSNTRYILGQAQAVEQLNAQLDAGKGRFRVLTNFSPVPKAGLAAGAQTTIDDVTWEPGPQGPLGVIEFTGALPRYKLFTSWEQNTDNMNTLGLLQSPDFDPHTRLIINDASVGPAKSTSAPTNAGTVQVVKYSPKRIQMKVEAAADSILLWNDRWSPNWKVTVDGQPAALLRANFIMRGIQVPSGAHEVVMYYEQPAKYLYVSFAAMAVGVLLCGFLALDGRKKQ